MVHIPAKFWENTWMRFQVTVRKLNVTDRWMGGRGALQYLPSHKGLNEGGNWQFLNTNMTIDIEMSLWWAGFMYSADADGRGHFIFIFLLLFFCMHISTGPIGARPRVRPLGSPPPPPLSPTHHDPMKIYRVYRYLHAQKYTLFVSN